MAPIRSQLEDVFDMWLTQHPDIPAPVSEYKFHPKRRWRLDRAWPEHKVAVEIEGGLYKGGRHQTLVGFTNDCEKYNAAAMLGWRVYRVPSPWLDRWNLYDTVMADLKELLGIGETE